MTWLRAASPHSLFCFAVLRHPEHAGTIGGVLALPPKPFERQLVSFLTDDEVDALPELYGQTGPKRDNDAGSLIELEAMSSSDWRITHSPPREGTRRLSLQ